MTGISERKRILHLLLTAAMLLALLLIFPCKAFAAETDNVTLDIANGSITLSETDGTKYYQQGSASTVAYTGEFTVTGTSTTNTVKAVSGEHNIVLSGVSIYVSSTYQACPLDLLDAGNMTTVTLKDGTINTLEAGNDAPGIRVPKDRTIVFNGTGTLNVTGGESWPGIGGQTSSGTIQIDDGTIYAFGGSNAAGIGHSWGHSGGNIVINGGTITATGGENGAGIGGGTHGNTANITINGGTITATGGERGAGIGGGTESGGGTITIDGGIVTAIGGNKGAGIGCSYKGHSVLITIDGGTVTATGGTQADGLGYGAEGSGAMTVIITGGSVKASSISNRNLMPQNTANELLSDTVINILTGYDINNLVIKNADGTDYSYGMLDMKPDESGKLYLWLPSGVTASAETTITFDSNGGSAVELIVGVPGTDVTAPADPTREGYTFEGWDPELPQVMPMEDMTLTAKWEANTYRIYYLGLEDGTINGEYADSYTYGVGTQLPTNVTREGYTFSGWYTASTGGTGPIGSVGEQATGDKFYYAQWTVNQYTITFDTDGGTAVPSITQDYGTDVIAPAAPTKTGYTFAGWDKEIPTTMPAENVTITAKWTVNQYTITFVDTGNDEIAPITQDYGTPVTAPANPTYQGYDFAGWKTKDSKDFAFTSSYTMPAESFELTAQWTPKGDTAYIVKHHFQKIENDAYYAPEVQNASGMTNALTAATAKTLAGFTPQTFEQKNISADGSTVIDIYYTRNKHTLTFKPENGEADIVSEVKFGASITAPDAPVKTGYTFNGWGEVAAKMPDENVTYTAQWTINQYTITFNANGGTALESITKDYGSTVTAPEAPKKTGFDFGGWYADKQLTTPYVFHTMPAANITVYAKWNPATGTAYTVKYYLQNTSGSGYTLYESETLRGTTNAETAAEVKNYPGFTAQTFAQTPILADGSAVVEIKYDRDIYTVTLVTNGGIIRDGDVTEYTYGVGAQLPTKITRSGYYFGGWYDNEDCMGVPVTEITTADIGNKTFYAKWDLDITPFLPLLIKYDVKVGNDIVGGFVTTDKTSASVNDKINIAVVPFEGYEIITVTVTDARGNAVTVTENGEGKYSFKMPMRDVTVYAVFNKTEAPITTETCPCDYTCPMYPFADLDMTAWYHDGVHFAIENGLMNGVGDNQFNPSGTTTRAMIVTILWRLEGGPDMRDAQWFEDVPVGQWYSDAIAWAAFNGIVDGYGNGYFGTNDAITREQMVTIMFRYAKYKGYDVSVGENTNILSYDDAFDMVDWAIPAMQWACGSGLIQGIADGNKMNLEPQGNATRAQAATILHRFCEAISKEEQ